MSIVSYINNINGPFLALSNDSCMRGCAAAHDLLNQDQAFFNKALSVLTTVRSNKKTVLDCGSNIGTFSIPLAKVYPHLNFVAFEVQRMIYYCFCGTVALQNTINVFPNFKGVGDKNYKLQVKVPDYTQWGNYGAYEAKRPFRNSDADFGYIEQHDVVDIVTIDSLNVDPILIKFDIEGMELAALAGAEQTIDIHEPVIYVERHKSNEQALLDFFASKPYTMHIAPDTHFVFVPNNLLPVLLEHNVFG